MRKIIVTEWMSIDGYVSGPENNMDFVGQHFSPEMGQYEFDFVSDADLLLLGHVTYDSFAGSWPKVPEKPDVDEKEKEYAQLLNRMKKIVFSKTMDKADWKNTTVMKNIEPVEIQKMKDEPGKNIIIYGSASIVQQLSEFSLIDEYQLLVHPVVLAGGKALFANVEKKIDLKLTDKKELPNGVIGLYYQKI